FVCVCLSPPLVCRCFFFFIVPSTTAIYPLSLHDALPICGRLAPRLSRRRAAAGRRRADMRTLVLTIVVAVLAAVSPWGTPAAARSEEHTSELQSRGHLVCRLLLEKKKKHHAERGEVLLRA